MSDSEGSAITSTLPPTGPVPRPPFQLRSLPIPFRWEATRRHPCYQTWWELARAHHRNDPPGAEVELLLRQAAVAILGSIGVSGPPPDPATDFEQLDADHLNSAWLSGAVHPITLRGLAALLIAGLPKESLGQVGLKLMEASCDDEEGSPPRRIQALNDLVTLDKPGLDSYPDEPIVSVNSAASGRQIEEAASQLLREWKEERELGEQRTRPDKFAEYLRVWDLREGWIDGGYDRTRERLLRDVATELKLSISTVHNHYRRAFEMIVGHPYSPELWYRLFAPLKLSDLFGVEPGAVSRHRPSTSPVRRDVPESVVSPTADEDEASQEGVVSGGSVTSPDADVGHMIAEIQRLIGEGLTDQQILGELNLRDEALPAVAYMRQRDTDLP